MVMPESIFTALTVDTSENTSYGFVVGRVRSLETALLDRGRNERLIHASDTEELRTILADTSYGHYLAEEFGRRDLGSMFAHAASDNYEFLSQYLLDRWVLDLFRLRADAHNLKMYVKALLVGSEVDEELQLGFGMLDSTRLVALAATEAKAEPAWMREGVVAATGRYTETSDPGAVDVIFDRLLHAQLLDMAREGPFILDYVRLAADVENLRTFVRLRALGEDGSVLESAFLPGGEVALGTLLGLLDEDREAVAARFRLTKFNRMMDEGMEYAATKKTLLRLERLGRELVLQYLRRARYLTFGYEPLVSYYLFRENELTNLRQLHAAKTAGLDESECQELVAYVE